MRSVTCVPGSVLPRENKGDRKQGGSTKSLHFLHTRKMQFYVRSAVCPKNPQVQEQLGNSCAHRRSSACPAEGNLLFQQYIFPSLEVLDEEPNNFKTK